MFPGGRDTDRFQPLEVGLQTPAEDLAQAAPGVGRDVEADDAAHLFPVALPYPGVAETTDYRDVFLQGRTIVDFFLFSCFV